MKTELGSGRFQSRSGSTDSSWARLRGADLILDPTCWVLVPDVVTPENPVSAYVHMALAHVNSLFVACADQCGIERGCTFLGRSCIAGPAGFVAGPAAFEAPEIVVAEINLAKARYHNWTSLANPFADRRTDLFDGELGYRHPTGAELAFHKLPGAPKQDTPSELVVALP